MHSHISSSQIIMTSDHGRSFHGRSQEMFTAFKTYVGKTGIPGSFQTLCFQLLSRLANVTTTHMVTDTCSMACRIHLHNTRSLATLLQHSTHQPSTSLETWCTTAASCTSALFCIHLETGTSTTLLRRQSMML